MTFWNVASTPCWRTALITFFTWSGRALAFPSSESLLSEIFISSVPEEMTEYAVRTSTPPGLQVGTGTSSRLSFPLL